MTTKIKDPLKYVKVRLEYLYNEKRMAHSKESHKILDKAIYELRQVFDIIKKA